MSAPTSHGLGNALAEATAHHQRALLRRTDTTHRVGHYTLTELRWLAATIQPDPPDTIRQRQAALLEAWDKDGKS